MEGSKRLHYQNLNCYLFYFKYVWIIKSTNQQWSSFGRFEIHSADVSLQYEIITAENNILFGTLLYNSEFNLLASLNSCLQKHKFTM